MLQPFLLIVFIGTWLRIFGNVSFAEQLFEIDLQLVFILLLDIWPDRLEEDQIVLIFNFKVYFAKSLVIIPSAQNKALAHFYWILQLHINEFTFLQNLSQPPLADSIRIAWD